MNIDREEIEQSHKKALKSIYILVAIEVVVLIATVSIFPMAAFFIALLVGILYYVFGGLRPCSEYKHMLKEFLVGEPFRNAFSGVRTHFSEGMDKELIRDAELIMTGNRYSSDDYIQGYYNDVAFSRADVTIANETRDSKGHTHKTVYFQGRWMIFQFPKKMANDIQIIGNGFGYAKSKNSIFTKKEERRHLVEMETTRFNKAFKVYAQYDQDAFYVLTPQMQEKIEQYCNRTQGRVMLGIIDNQLHVAINNRRNAMEPSVLRKVDYAQMLSEVNEEIELIKYTIDQFKLDTEYYQGAETVVGEYKPNRKKFAMVNDDMQLD